MKAGYVWEELYEAAVLETDPEKRSKRLQAAKSAINDRLQELLLNHGGAPEERHAISKALSAVDILRREIKRRDHDERL